MIEKQLLQNDRLTALGVLSASIAHEINNPLGYILTSLEIAVEFLKENPTAHPLEESLLQALQGVERVRKIVQGLKLFSRNDEDASGPVNLHNVLQSVICMSFNEIRPRAKLLQNNGGLPIVRGNSVRLGQVFLNLIINAAQSIPEGNQDSNAVTISTLTDVQGNAVVEVRDTGCGIVPGDLDRIFDPFYTTKPVGVGTGLGLSVCHGIVSSHGGRIEVATELNKGSSFKVILPPAPPELALAPEPESGVEVQPTRRGRILVIDDEVALASAFGRLLSREHEVVTLSCPRKALELLQRREQRFDIIFCDLIMPDLTGMDLYDILNGEGHGTEKRMVFLTGGAFTPRSAQFLAKVPNMRMEKPMDAKTTRALVSELLSTQ